MHLLLKAALIAFEITKTITKVLVIRLICILGLQLCHGLIWVARVIA